MCGAHGLVCSDAELEAHNDEVDTPAEVLAIVGASVTLTEADCETNIWKFTPSYSLGDCYAKSSSSGSGKFDCSKESMP